MISVKLTIKLEHANFKKAVAADVCLKFKNMKLHSLATKLDFGQHEGETLTEILKSNPSYIEWCYETIDDFFITDTVWNAMKCNVNLQEVLKSGVINMKEVEKAIAQNKKWHHDKRTNYKKIMVKNYNNSLEKVLKDCSVDEDIM